MSEIILKVNNLCKVFGQKENKVVACNDINLELRRGETLGIVGESGSGKSTLARILIGLEKATSGEVNVLGTNLSDIKDNELRSFRQSIQIVFQDVNSVFNPRFKVFDILKEPMDNFFNYNKDEKKELALKLLSDVNLPSDILNRYPNSLSGGQRQRLAIARALVADPEILICDEATSALDVSIQKDIIDLLEELKTEKTLSIIFVSHDLALMENISDAIIVMSQGHIVERISKGNLSQTACHPISRKLIESVYTFDDDKINYKTDVEVDNFYLPGISKGEKEYFEVQPNHYVALEI